MLAWGEGGRSPSFCLPLLPPCFKTSQSLFIISRKVGNIAKVELFFGHVAWQSFGGRDRCKPLYVGCFVSLRLFDWGLRRDVDVARKRSGARFVSIATAAAFTIRGVRLTLRRPCSEAKKCMHRWPDAQKVQCRVRLPSALHRGEHGRHTLHGHSRDLPDSYCNQVSSLSLVVRALLVTTPSPFHPLAVSGKPERLGSIPTGYNRQKDNVRIQFGTRT